MADLKFPRVLVTGATGFLGREIIARLMIEGYAVTGIGGSAWPKEQPITAYRVGNLASDYAVECYKDWAWDAVIHAAGRIGESRTILDEHVQMALQVGRAWPRGWAGRLIHLSSMTVYGLPVFTPMHEQHPRQPVNWYGLAKKLAEDVLTTRFDDAASDLWMLRLPGIFSESRTTGAVAQFVREAATGGILTLTATQPTPWDLLHLDEAVEAVLLALQSDQSHPGPVNISYGEPVEVEMIARRIAKWGGARVENRTGVVHPVCRMDTTKARSYLGWRPPTLAARLERLWIACGEPQLAVAKGRSA